jgi:hypothetical protein
MKIFFEKIKNTTIEINEYNVLKENKIPNQWNRWRRMYAKATEIISITNTNSMNVGMLF